MISICSRMQIRFRPPPRRSLQLVLTSACAATHPNARSAQEDHAISRHCHRMRRSIRELWFSKHVAPSVHALPAASAALGNKLAERSVDVENLKRIGTQFLHSMDHLREAGLSVQHCLALAKQQTGGDDVFRIGLAESLSKLPTSWTISPCLPLRRGLALLASTQTQPSVSSCLAATAGWVF